ncbi:MAG: hypothetical protein JST10_14950 [Bacteroidetes bacterium]|nr:hypothetical protein [Bacteroidota bacterium]
MKLTSVLISICMLESCSKFQAPKVQSAADISVIDDRTDTLLQHPIADPILALYHFENDQEKAANFRLVVITDKVLNPLASTTLDNSEMTEQRNEKDDVYNREQVINSFYNTVRYAIAEFPKQYSSKPLAHSECFATIATELERMSKSKASQRTLIIFSDLQENTDAFSCYSEDDQKMLTEKPKRITDILCKHRELPKDLSGIVIYFVFQPRDRSSERMFFLIVNQVYKKLLEPKGARIVIQAQNNQYSL